jgi:hypothetical protein
MTVFFLVGGAYHPISLHHSQKSRSNLKIANILIIVIRITSYLIHMHRENATRESKKRNPWKMNNFKVKFPPSANPK